MPAPHGPSSHLCASAARKSTCSTVVGNAPSVWMASRQNKIPRSRRYFPMAVMFQPVAADEMAGGQRDEPRVFVHLAHHVNRADDAEAARVEQAHLHAFFRQRHPRINVGRIIVVIDEDVVALAKFQAGGDEAQRRARSARRARLRRAGSSTIAPPVCARRPGGASTNASWSPSVALLGAFGDRVGDAARQRADAGVRREKFCRARREIRGGAILRSSGFHSVSSG